MKRKNLNAHIYKKLHQYATGQVIAFLVLSVLAVLAAAIQAKDPELEKKLGDLIFLQKLPESWWKILCYIDPLNLLFPTSARENII
jgi:hypothetical protein